jgi:hypothetical protein
MYVCMNVRLQERKWYKVDRYINSVGIQVIQKQRQNLTSRSCFQLICFSICCTYATTCCTSGEWQNSTQFNVETNNLVCISFSLVSPLLTYFVLDRSCTQATTCCTQINVYTNNVVCIILSFISPLLTLPLSYIANDVWLVRSHLQLWLGFLMSLSLSFSLCRTIQYAWLGGYWHWRILYWT